MEYSTTPYTRSMQTPWVPQRKRRFPWLLVVLLVLVAGGAAGGAYLWQSGALAGGDEHEGWYQYRSEDGGFTAMFPSQPIVTEHTDDTQIGKLTLHMIECRGADYSYIVTWWDYPPNTPFSLQRAVDGVTALWGGRVDATHFAVHQGREALLADCSGEGVKLRELLTNVNNRMYVIGIINRLDDWKYFEENFRIDDAILALGTKGTSVHKGEPDAEPKPDPLVFRDPTNVTAWVGRNETLKYEASGGLPPYSWRIEGLPEGWQTFPQESREWNRTTMAVKGKSAKAGTYQVSIHVEDYSGQSRGESMEVQVRPLPDPLLGMSMTGPTTDKQAACPRLVDGALQVYPGQNFGVSIKPNELSGALGAPICNFNYTDLPASVNVRMERNELSAAGQFDEPGEWTLHVDAEVRLWGFDKAFKISGDYKLECIPIDKGHWPLKGAGKIDEYGGLMDTKYEGLAKLTMQPISFAYGPGDWPSEINWEWDEDTLPPGTAASADGNVWKLEGKPTQPGTYNVKVHGTVRLKWVDKDYAFEHTLRVRVE